MEETMGKFLLVALLALMALAPLQAAAGDKVAFPKGYEKWEKSKMQVVTDKKSLFYGIHYTYVDKKAMKMYRTGGPYPEGSSFVVVQYAIKDTAGTPVAGKKQMIVLMKKDRTFAQTGGWQFAGFTADGRPSGIDPVQNCFECHLKTAKATDYIISKFADFK
jgi:hypothetical protein